MSGGLDSGHRLLRGIRTSLELDDRLQRDSDELFACARGDIGLAAANGQRPAGFDHPRTRNRLARPGRSQQVDLVLGRENGGVGGEQAQGSKTARAIDDHAHDPAVNDFMLLGQVVAIGENDLHEARFNNRERGADVGHGLLARKLVAYAFPVTGVLRPVLTDVAHYWGECLVREAVLVLIASSAKFGLHMLEFLLVDLTFGVSLLQDVPCGLTPP